MAEHIMCKAMQRFHIATPLSMNLEMGPQTDKSFQSFQPLPSIFIQHLILEETMLLYLQNKVAALPLFVFCKGEEVWLYSGEVGCEAGPAFAVSACHTTVLAPGQSLLEFLAISEGSEEALSFKVRTTARYEQEIKKRLCCGAARLGIPVVTSK
jgi:hypothetical protein